MIKRILSTIGLWAITLGALYFWHATGALWLLVIASILAQHELYVILEHKGYRPLKYRGMLLGALLILAVGYAPSAHEACVEFTAISISLISLSILVQNIQGREHPRLIPTLFGFLYVPFLMQYYVLLMRLPSNLTIGLASAFWVVAVSKFTDVGGLLIGTYAGKHKLAKNISPSKTWEGAAGGLVLAILCSMLVQIGLKNYLPQALTLGAAILLAIPVAITAIISDLVESALKRISGVKDSGAVLPGIGGAFDLLDSLILGGPVSYLLFKYCIF